MIVNPAVLFGLDGITLDARGNIFGAVNYAKTIVCISNDGDNLSEVVSGTPLDFPSSLAFVTGRTNHTLFIVKFGVIHFLGNPPMPDDANPVVTSIKIDY